MTLLALDVAANTKLNDPTVYSYASLRTGDPSFASTLNQVVKNSFRIANRIDIVPMLPWPPAYENVQTPIDLNPVQLLPLPPKILVNLTVDCSHSLDTYLYFLFVASGGAGIPLDPECEP